MECILGHRRKSNLITSSRNSYLFGIDADLYTYTSKVGLLPNCELRCSYIDYFYWIPYWWNEQIPTTDSWKKIILLEVPLHLFWSFIQSLRQAHWLNLAKSVCIKHTRHTICRCYLQNWWTNIWSQNPKRASAKTSLKRK